MAARKRSTFLETFFAGYAQATKGAPKVGLGLQKALLGATAGFSAVAEKLKKESTRERVATEMKSFKFTTTPVTQFTTTPVATFTEKKATPQFEIDFNKKIQQTADQLKQTNKVVSDQQKFINNISIDLGYINPEGR